MVGLAVMVALVLGVATTAMSTTGKPFILGKLNEATQTSKLVKNGAGAALSLMVREGQPPLKVNSEGRVSRLNSDMVDGKHAGAFLPRGGKAANSEKLDGRDSSEFTTYESIVVVSPVGSATENGQALLDALAGINASQEHSALLYIEPGTYNLGNRSLQMKEYVDIEGAGELRTIVTGTVSSAESGGDCTNGTVQGANNAELRFLTVRNTNGTACGVGIYNHSASPRLTQVSAESTAGVVNIGVLNNSSSPTMTNVTAYAPGGGLAVQNIDASPKMFNVTATSSGGISNSAVRSAGTSNITIRNSRLSASESGELNSSFALAMQGGSTVKVAGTQLVGNINMVGGTLQCFGNYDENMQPVSCPQ
jgi:hypothetical protein